LAEKYQIPVIILGDQYLADTTRTVARFDIDRIKVASIADSCDCKNEGYKRYKLTDSGISPRLIPGKCEKCLVLVDSDEHDEDGRITESSQVRIDMCDKRMKKIRLLQKELIEPYFYGDEKCDELIVAWGSLDGAVSEAVTILNQQNKTKYGALVFGDIYPLPQKMLKQKSVNMKKLINVEQNATGQLASLIREQTGIACTHSILKYDGRQLSGEEIAQRIMGGDFNV
jgi:2-oxoglutarate ferredoxin oxidoreductase subunit alpha